MEYKTSTKCFSILVHQCLEIFSMFICNRIFQIFPVNGHNFYNSVFVGVVYDDQLSAQGILANDGNTPLRGLSGGTLPVFAQGYSMFEENNGKLPKIRQTGWISFEPSMSSLPVLSAAPSLIVIFHCEYSQNKDNVHC